MRLAFAIFKWFPYGGIQRDLMKIAREAVARGHEVKVFTLRWSGPEPEEVELELIPIVGFNRHTQYDHFARELNDRVRADHFDLVVGFNKMPGLDVYYAGDSCYIEKALEQREAWYRLLPRFKSFHAAERAVFGPDNKTEILTISNVEIPRYRHHYKTPPERLHPLPPGIEKDRVAPDNRAEIRQQFRTELGLDDQHLMVLFVGSGFKKKGLDRALLAIAALPGELRQRVRFYVIGHDKAEAFERMSMRLGIKDLVTFFADGRNDIPNFLFSADALLHPAYDETAGMVIVESMLAGLPALATRNCGYAHYLSEYAAGMVLDVPLTQERLNAALEELLTSPRRDEWRQNGLAAAKEASFFGLVDQTVDYLETFHANNKPTIAFALFRYFPFGGLQRDFMRIARACCEAGYHVLVYCLSWQAPKPDEFEIFELEANNVTNHARYTSFAEQVQELVRWRRPLALVGFNKMPGLDLYYAADSCFEHKAQTMRTALYRRTERYRAMSKLERAVFDAASATQIMLIAPAQRKEFQTYYQTPDSRLVQLPPGVSRDRKRSADWEAERARVRGELNVGEDDYLVLLIGSGFITKGLDRALEAIAALPSQLAEKTHFLVIGQDNPYNFLKQARQLGVDERLTIMKGRDDIPQVLQGGDVMLHPAYMESGGLVLIEAVIAGLPVIATEVCGFSYLIEEAQAGVVVPEPFDQSYLNSTLQTVLCDVGRRAEWSKNGVAFGIAREDLYDMPDHARDFIVSHLPPHRLTQAGG